MTEQQSMDFERAESRRDLGMERATAKADRSNCGWSELAFAALRAYAQTHAEPFLIEDMRLEVDPKLPPTDNKRAWGKVVIRAAAAQIIKNTRQSRPAKSSNLSPKWLWQSLICTS